MNWQTLPWYVNPNFWAIIGGIVGLLTFLLIIIGYFVSESVKKVINLLYLKYFPVSFNVAIHIESVDTKDSGIYNSELKKQLIKLMDENNLNHLIKIKDYQDIKLFRDVNGAQKYRKSKELDLIIWGEFSADGLKRDGKDYSELNLKFTFKYPEDKRGNIGRLLSLEFQDVGAAKNYWKIIDHSIEDLKIIQENVFDLSIYILATTLFLFGKIKDSISLLEVLIKKIDKSSTDAYSRVIVDRLIAEYSLLISLYVYRGIDYVEGKRLCMKIISLDNKNQFAFTNLAYCEFKLGNIIESERVASLMQNHYPNSPSVWVNMGFFRILQKKYNQSFKYYKKIKYISVKKIDFEVMNTISFLDDQYENNKKEPGFLYASAILNLYFGDSSVVKYLLEQFMYQASKTEYHEMYKEASKIYKTL